MDRVRPGTDPALLLMMMMMMVDTYPECHSENHQQQHSSILHSNNNNNFNSKDLETASWDSQNHSLAHTIKVAQTRKLAIKIGLFLLAFSFIAFLAALYPNPTIVAPLARLQSVLRQFPVQIYKSQPRISARSLGTGSMAARTPPQAPPSFKHNSETVLSDTKKLIEKSRSLQDSIVKSVTPEKANFENVIKPLATDENEFSFVSHILGFYQYMSTDAALRTASSEAEKLLDVRSFISC